MSSTRLNMPILRANHVFRATKWVFLLLLILLHVAIVLRVNLGVITCQEPKTFYLSSNATTTKCFDENRYSLWSRSSSSSRKQPAPHGNHPAIRRDNRSTTNGQYLRDSKDKLDAYTLYEFNCGLFIYILIAVMSSFGVCLISWHFRSKLKKNDFVLNPTRLLSAKTDNELSDRDDRLVEAFKIVIKKKGRKIRKNASAFFLVLIIMNIVLVLIILSIPYQYFFLFVGLEEFKKLLNSNAHSLFPFRKLCKVYNPYTINDGDSISEEIIECNLTLNKFFLASYLIIWFILIFMILLIFICVCFLIIMTNFHSCQQTRLKEILPSIDKKSLERLVSSTFSYFIVEELYSKLKKEPFEKLMQMLAEEDYCIDKELTEIADV